MKIVRKISFFIIIIFLCTAVLSACTLSNPEFVPKSLNPEDFSHETQNDIKELYLLERNKEFDGAYKLTIDEVWIEKYLGTYGGSHAVLLYNKNIVPGEGIYIYNEMEVVIDGVSFFYDGSVSVAALIYNNGAFYSLQNAYDDGLLKKDDLKSIAYYQNKETIFPEREHKKPLDEKKIWNGNIDQNFDDITIIMVIDKNYTDWRFYASDFKNVNVVSVRSLMVLRLMNPNAGVNNKDFHDIISIEIGNPGKQNVIDAIRELEKLEFVMSAEPNYLYQCVDD